MARHRITRSGPIHPIWLFGYGSLIWKQDFPFLESRPSWITGWSRRFWQGSHDHRGLPDDPGRVVTLIETQGETCVGRAFLIEPEVFRHLDHREKNGYERVDVTIEFESGCADGVMYHATENNFAFLGPAPVHEITAQIHRCSGPSGSNREYLLQLAHALRTLGTTDQHVFTLEKHLLSLSTVSAHSEESAPAGSNPRLVAPRR